MVDSLKLYEALKTADLTEGQARSITQAIGSALEGYSEVQDKALASKVAVDRFESEMHRIDDTLKQEAALLRAEMEVGFERLDKNINGAKTEMIRWMFAFWAGQLAAIVAIVFGAIKLLK